MKGELAPGEAHPASLAAKAWLSLHATSELLSWQEGFASSALAGDRFAEVCSETLRRLMANEPVGERYLLGLAWVMQGSRYTNLQ